MSAKPDWNHSKCEACWVQTEGEWIPAIGQEDGAEQLVSMRQPVMVRNLDKFELKRCCYCGSPTFVGIYVRADPSGMLCEGVHE